MEKVLLIIGNVLELIMEKNFSDFQCYIFLFFN